MDLTTLNLLALALSQRCGSRLGRVEGDMGTQPTEPAEKLHTKIKVSQYQHTKKINNNIRHNDKTTENTNRTARYAYYRRINRTRFTSWKSAETSGFFN